MAQRPMAELSAGGIAGAATMASGFPFDTVKVRLQAERGVYRGAWDCFKHILRHDGVSADICNSALITTVVKHGFLLLEADYVVSGVNVIEPVVQAQRCCCVIVSVGLCISHREIKAFPPILLGLTPSNVLQIRGLYRGLTPPMIGGAIETGINFLVSCLLGHQMCSNLFVLCRESIFHN